MRHIQYDESGVLISDEDDGQPDPDVTLTDLAALADEVVALRAESEARIGAAEDALFFLLTNTLEV